MEYQRVRTREVKALYGSAILHEIIYKKRKLATFQFPANTHTPPFSL